jgi:hypothetical protein
MQDITGALKGRYGTALYSRLGSLHECAAAIEQLVHGPLTGYVGTYPQKCCSCIHCRVRDRKLEQQHLIRGERTLNQALQEPRVPVELPASDRRHSGALLGVGWQKNQDSPDSPSTEQSEGSTGRSPQMTVGRSARLERKLKDSTTGSTWGVMLRSGANNVYLWGYIFIWI